MSATTDRPAPAPPQRSGTKGVVQLVFGSIAVLLALALLAGGVAAVWGLSQRDSDGYFTTEGHRLSTATYAFASESLDIGPDAPGWIGDFAKVRIQASSAKPVFVGIGPASDVQRYLRRVEHSEVTDFDTDPFRVTAHDVAGSDRPAAPASQGFWRVQASGSGTQTIAWPLEKGNWSAVVMNADGSRDVAMTLRVGARVPALRWVAIGFLAGGGLLLVLGGALVYLGARARSARPA
jgi:hypothetical protein